MALDIDQRLGKFDDGDVTVRICNALLAALPFVDPLPVAATMSQVIEAMAPGQQERVLAQAKAIAGEEAAHTSLWIATGMDAGDGVVPIVSSLRSALALYLNRKSKEEDTSKWAGMQAGDAVLKGLAIAEILRRLVDADPPERVRMLAMVPAGRALLSYFAAAEVALPFVDELVGTPNPLAELVAARLDSQTSRLGKIVGHGAVDGARTQLDAMLFQLEAIVSATTDRIEPLAEAANRYVPGSLELAGSLGTAFATGADLLPMYRFLGGRLVAELSAWRALRAVGIEPDTSKGDAFLERFPVAPPPPAEAEPEGGGGLEVAAAEEAPAEGVEPVAGEEPPAEPTYEFPAVPTEQAPEDEPTPATSSPPPVPVEVPRAEPPPVPVEVPRAEPPPEPAKPPPEPVKPPPPEVARAAPKPVPLRSEPVKVSHEGVPPARPDVSSAARKVEPAAPPPQRQPVAWDEVGVVEEKRPRPKLLAVAVALVIVALVACGGFALLGGGAGLVLVSGDGGTAVDKDGKGDGGSTTDRRGSGSKSSRQGGSSSSDGRSGTRGGSSDKQKGGTRSDKDRSTRKSGKRKSSQ